MKKILNKILYLIMAFHSLDLPAHETVSEWQTLCFNPPFEKLSMDQGYTLELADPLHRHANILRPAFHLWKTSYEESMSDFWSFIDQEKSLLIGEYPALYDESYQMLWLDCTEKRANYETFFKNSKDGNTIIASTNIGPLEDGKWMYIMMDGRFYTIKERKYQIHHSSLSGGLNVESAGTITIEKGEVVNIAFVSGHYKPKIEQGFSMLYHLIGLGLKLHGIKITYGVIGPGSLIKKNVSIDDFLNCKIDLNYEAGEMFFYPLNCLEYKLNDKIKLFFTNKGEFYVGSAKMGLDDPLCADYGPFVGVISLSLCRGEIKRVSFNKCLDLPPDVKKMRLMIDEMCRLGFDFDGVVFRVILGHKRTLMTYDEFQWAVAEN